MAGSLPKEKELIDSKSEKSESFKVNNFIQNNRNNQPPPSIC